MARELGTQSDMAAANMVSQGEVMGVEAIAVYQQQRRAGVSKFRAQRGCAHVLWCVITSPPPVSQNRCEHLHRRKLSGSYRQPLAAREQSPMPVDVQRACMKYISDMI
eukprot:jgi/Ulvmu1/11859/UM081_0017.1